MPEHISLKKLTMFIAMTAMTLTLTTAIAEAGAGGAGLQSPPLNTGRAGRAYAPKALPALPVQKESRLEDVIVDERVLIRVQASEAESLLNALRTQLMTQPDAKLSIRWLLTRPAGVK